MSLAALVKAGRSPTLPVTLELAGEPLVVEVWLRTLPGQRYVGRALWRGRQVLAKLFVGGKAQRQYARELSGATRLAAAAVHTPSLLAHGQQRDGCWLLFEFLEGAQSLQHAWESVAAQSLLSDAQRHVLAQALEALGRLHSQGLWQADLHLDNLLRLGTELYWIDGGGVEAQTPGQPLARDKVLQNLGVFFAQLPATLEPFLEELLIHYLLANGSHALPLEALLKEIARVRRWRLADYLDKAGRECTLFSARVGAFGLRIARRNALPLLAPVLDAPNRFIEQGRLCKGGGTATVAAFELQAQPLLIKRYNIKGLRHWLSRFWRPSRAWHSWIEGHRLEQLGVATAKPLAVIERRWFGLRGTAWLVTEFLTGEDATRHWAPYVDSLPPDQELQSLQALFESLQRLRISHGDLKGHNLFWSSGQWVLIDLDAVQQHTSQASFARAYAKDRARFLRNWPEQSLLYQTLDARLPK